MIPTSSVGSPNVIGSVTHNVRVTWSWRTLGVGGQELLEMLPAGLTSTCFPRQVLTFAGPRRKPLLARWVEHSSAPSSALTETLKRWFNPSPCLCLWGKSATHASQSPDIYLVLGESPGKVHLCPLPLLKVAREKIRFDGPLPLEGTVAVTMHRGTATEGTMVVVGRAGVVRGFYSLKWLASYFSSFLMTLTGISSN